MKMIASFQDLVQTKKKTRIHEFQKKKYWHPEITVCRFLKIFLADTQRSTHVLFYRGHWYPCFGFLVTSPLSGFCLIRLFCGGKYNVHSPRSTSVATPADPLMTSITAGHFPTCITVFYFITEHIRSMARVTFFNRFCHI